MKEIYNNRGVMSAPLRGFNLGGHTQQCLNTANKEGTKRVFIQKIDKAIC